MAVAMALVYYIPAFFLRDISSDTLAAPLMFHDVVELGNPLRDWEWGGHSDIFPDLSLVFLVDFFLRASLPTLQTVSCILFMAFILVLALVYRQAGGRRAGIFGVALLSFFLLLFSNFGIRRGLDFYSFLNVAFHTGTVIGALGCLALCMRTATAGGTGSLAWLGALCFLTGVSDALFVVVFPVPMLATLGVARLFYPGRLRSFFPIVATIAVSSAAAYFLAARFSPALIEPGVFTQVSVPFAVESWRLFCALCAPSRGGCFVVFIALDILYLLFGIAFLAACGFRQATPRVALPVFIVVLFGMCVIGSNWGAEILTGNLRDIYATRQVRLALLFPVFLLLGFLCNLAAGSKVVEKWVVTILSVAAGAFAFFCAPAPGPQYLQARQLAPILHDLMQREHIEAGLADYWYANRLTFFLPWDSPLRAVYKDGSLYHWLSTTGWYAGGGNTKAPPAFRLVLMPKLDPAGIKRTYGAPDRIITVLPGDDVWIYPEERAIRYTPVFGALTNGPANEFRVDGDFMGTYTGHVEGTALVARQGRDPASFLAFGPAPYLRPVGGRYRLTFSYAYTAKPEHESVYDLICTPGTHTHWLDAAHIPCIDGGHHEFTREFRIPDERRGQIQVRVQYAGSGDLSFDWLKIVYLGK